MKQDKYRPLVEKEYDETWDPEELDDASQLAWRCTCAQTVLARLGPQERAELETASKASTQARLAEWEGSSPTEEDSGGDIDEETRALFAYPFPAHNVVLID